MLVVVMDLRGGRCHERQIRQVSTVSLARFGELLGVPAILRISTSLVAAACHKRIRSLFIVRLTTASSELCSNLMERRRSNDAHAAAPTEVCVSAWTPVALAGTTRVWASLLDSGRLRSISCSVPSSSSSSAAGSTAGLRIGVRAFWGARGGAGALLPHGSFRRGRVGSGFDCGIASSSASGAGAPGRHRRAPLLGLQE